MGWHKLVFPLLSSNPAQQAFTITALAQNIDEQAGNPKGFAIFSGWEFGEDNASTNSVLYFSPVAASLCANAIAQPLIPCEKPDQNEEGFGLAYGDLQGPSSWDLLK